MVMTARIETRYSRLFGFRHWWAKSVVSFNPEHHCINSFKGQASKVFRTYMPVNEFVPLEFAEGDIVYFCGVADPWCWGNNMHLAGTSEEGSESSVFLYTGDRLVIQGLRRIEFDDRVAVQEYADKGPKWATCRNFQFAAQMFKEGRIPLYVKKERKTRKARRGRPF